MRNAGIALIVTLAVASTALAQGRGSYFNVESPQVHPIEVATIGGQDYLLICNTPDNSVEVWSTGSDVDPARRLVLRIPVGLEPVSVRWVAELERMFVANFLGDSISAIVLTPNDGDVPLRPIFVGTVDVTDEPLDIAYTETLHNGELRPTLYVTHMTLDAISRLSAHTLEPFVAEEARIDAALSADADIDFDGEIDDIAIKEPRAIAVACDRLFVLGHKGGNTIRYDFDLYIEDLNDGTKLPLGGLGSTNWNMAFGANDELYVVGGMARNELRDEQNVAAAPTGFVTSELYVVENACSDNPTVKKRDVNLRRLMIGHAMPIELQNDSSPGMTAFGQLGATQMISSTAPVRRGRALTQLTSVQPFGSPAAVEKLFVTAFGTDRIGVIEPDPNVAPLDWPIRKIDITPITAPIAGPRAMALRRGENPELYVLNRIDNSVTVIDPVAESVIDSFGLRDPTPDYITEGRRFLYDAKLSGNFFNSCASCHTDGRTDGLAWDLGDGVAVAIPPELMPSPTFGLGFFRPDKEFMVTQTLQGLLNWEVPQQSQKLFTNGPYHWRADRADFTKFNPAFEGLLGGDQLSDPDMLAYEEFVNSINYPPNPNQPLERTLSGTLGDPDDNFAPANISGDGGLKGLKMFHIANSDGFSCVKCHTLPEGSDNVHTEDFQGVNPHPVPAPPLMLSGRKIMETAALRLLYQKEARLERSGTSRHEDAPVTGYEGMLHTGLEVSFVSADFNGTATTNAFNKNFFSGFCGGIEDCDNLQAVNTYLKEFDTGTAPRVGESFTVEQADAQLASVAAQIDDAEAQAHVANAGLVAHYWSGATHRGFWYDVTVTPAIYREEPSGAAFDRAQLRNLLTDTRDRLIFQSVPLGSERRVAHPDGKPDDLPGPDPSGIALLPMIPNEAYVDVPKFTKFWDNNGDPFFGGTHSHTTRLYQWGLINDAPNGFGLCELRHEAPRKLRVAGHDIRHGASLELRVADDPNAGAPLIDIGPDDPGQVRLLTIELPLHPTDELDADGARVWETAAELEAMLFYRLMVGRPDQSGLPAPTLVELTSRDHLTNIPVEDTPGLFDPVAWNNHWVRVVNADGTSGEGSDWQQLTIEPGPDCDSDGPGNVAEADPPVGVP